MRVQREGGLRDPSVSRPRRGSRGRLFLLLLGLLVLVLPATVALAAANDRVDQAGQAASTPDDNSEADITVTFSADCTDFDVESSKDISFVSVNYENPPDYTYEKFDGLSGHEYSHDGDTPIKSVVVKSGTTRAVFNCPEGGGEVDPDPDEKPECSDGSDNDGDDKVDHPADPGCQTPDDDDERDGGDEPGPCDDKGGDTDKDGVCDDVDECPNEAGPAENNGCPEDPDPCKDKGGDTDGDGVCDDVDECPNEKGKPKNNGCPSDPCKKAGGDSDKDGVCDDVDECPNEPGPAENNGCPEDPDPCEDAGGDTDGDGVCDDVDECPNEAGPAENNGCPEDGENLCTAAADDPGLLTDDTLGQTIWDGGADALSPLTEDPERNGVISGPLGEAGTDTEIEVLTDEASCALDLLLDEEVAPVDL